jgi:hypothetical protein
MPDGAVLPRGVQRLQANQHRPAVLRGQLVLVFREQADAGFQEFDAVLLAQDARLVTGVEILGQVDSCSGFHPQRLYQLADQRRPVANHGRPSLAVTEPGSDQPDIPKDSSLPAASEGSHWVNATAATTLTRARTAMIRAKGPYQGPQFPGRQPRG